MKVAKIYLLEEVENIFIGNSYYLTLMNNKAELIELSLNKDEFKLIVKMFKLKLKRNDKYGKGYE